MIRALLLACVLTAPALAQSPASEDPSARAVPSDAPPTEASPAPAADAPPAPLAIDPSDLIGAPAGPPLTGDALRDQTYAIAKLLRCPTCQGLSVADSRAEGALAMKAEVEALAAQGYDAEQVLLYFEASYGEFIRLEPKFEGVNVLVWVAPVLLLLAGAGWVFGSVAVAGRRARAAAPSSAPPPTTGGEPGADAPSADPADPALAAYLRRVREESR